MISAVEQLPETIAGYQLERRLSAGGMGVVYLASRKGAHDFEKKFAIKLLLPHLFERDDIKQLFTDEARLAARLSHPNICQVFDFGEEHGLYFLVMEYIDGVRVFDILRAQQRLGVATPQTLAARVVADAARGLHYAHELRGSDGKLFNVVHRDVSPENIFVGFTGCTKVLDFGIARWADRISVTLADVVRGKAPYMSPEQAQSLPLDRRSDIFALGVVLFELLTGQPLFHRGSVLTSMRAVVEDPIPDPRILQPDLHPGLARVVARALARDRSERIATAEGLTIELEDVLSELSRQSTAEALAYYVRDTVMPALDRPVPIGLVSTDPAAGGPATGLSPHSGAVLVAAARARATEAFDARDQAPTQREQAAGLAVDAQPDELRTTRSIATAFRPRLWPGVLVGAGVAVALFAAILLLPRWLTAPPDPVDDPGLTILVTTDAAAASALPDAAANSVGPIAPSADAAVNGALAGDLDSGRRLAPAKRPPRSIRHDAATAAPLPGGTGTISVFATPWANVRVDGELKGPTPLVQFELPAGSHLVEIIAPDTNRVRDRRQVVVEAGRAARVTARSE